MTRSVVTGAAGFIGSTLCESLLDLGHSVVGIDRFNDNYSWRTKQANMAVLDTQPGYEFILGDLAHADLDELLEGADLVFHQAGQPGVRTSWSSRFSSYVEDNIIATQRILDAVRRHPQVQRVVYASSSSIYGNQSHWPVSEDDTPRPLSPYGMTKLAAEHLCNLYAENYGVPVVSLRYFTVYGPRQRPDMAIYNLVESALRGHPFPLFGDGSQVRDFTFVDDIVRANLLSVSGDRIPAGTVMNIAGTQGISMSGLIELVEELVGAPVVLDRSAEVPGDVKRTGGSIERARALLGWQPEVSLRDGLIRQIAWHRSQLASARDLAPA